MLLLLISDTVLKLAFKRTHSVSLNSSIHQGNRKSHALSIDTKIDDLGWPWTAISSNSLAISRDVADLGANNG